MLEPVPPAPAVPWSPVAVPPFPPTQADPIMTNAAAITDDPNRAMSTFSLYPRFVGEAQCNAFRCDCIDGTTCSVKLASPRPSVQRKR